MFLLVRNSLVRSQRGNIVARSSIATSRTLDSCSFFGSKNSKKSLKKAAAAETAIAKQTSKADMAKADSSKKDSAVQSIKPPSNYIRPAGKGTKSWEKPTGGSLSQKRMN